MSNEISHAKNSISLFTKKIIVAWQRVASSIIEVGNHLNDAKNVLTPREYRDLIRDLEDRNVMSRSTISKLSMIAKNSVLTNTEYQNLLPPSYETLYTLTRQDRTVLEEKIKHGEITAETQRKDIPVIFDQITSKPKPSKSSMNKITITGDLEHLPETHLQNLKNLLRKISKSSSIKVSGISLD